MTFLAFGSSPRQGFYRHRFQPSENGMQKSGSRHPERPARSPWSRKRCRPPPNCRQNSTYPHFAQATGPSKRECRSRRARIDTAFSVPARIVAAGVTNGRSSRTPKPWPGPAAGRRCAGPPTGRPWCWKRPPQKARNLLAAPTRSPAPLGLPGQDKVPRDLSPGSRPPPYGRKRRRRCRIDAALLSEGGGPDRGSASRACVTRVQWPWTPRDSAVDPSRPAPATSTGTARGESAMVVREQGLLARRDTSTPTRATRDFNSPLPASWMGILPLTSLQRAFGVPRPNPMFREQAGLAGRRIFPRHCFDRPPRPIAHAALSSLRDGRSMPRRKYSSFAHRILYRRDRRR